MKHLDSATSMMLSWEFWSWERSLTGFFMLTLIFTMEMVCKLLQSTLANSKGSTLLFQMILQRYSLKILFAGVEDAFSFTSKVMSVSFHKFSPGFFPGNLWQSYSFVCILVFFILAVWNSCMLGLELLMRIISPLPKSC